MDKEELIYSIKTNKKNRNKKQIKNQKNYLNETEEKFVITTKNDLITNDDNDNLQGLPNTYKKLDILISNRLQSLGNNKENKQTSSNLIKKQNNFNNNNLIKQTNNFPKQPVFKLIMNKSHTEKSNETSNQSVSLLLNKDINNSREQNSINNLNKNTKTDSSNKYNTKIIKSSENIRKKKIAKLPSYSPCSSYLLKNQSFNKNTHRNLFFHESSNKIINKKILYFAKSERQIKKNILHDKNHFQNKQKHIAKIKKSNKNNSKKSLSNDNFNNNFDIIRTTKSLKTPKIFINTIPQFRRKKHSAVSFLTSSSQSFDNSDLNFNNESNLTSNNKKRARFHRKFQRNKKIELTFSNLMQEYNNYYKTNKKKKEKPQTSLIANKIHEENLYSILLSNKPNKMKEANKIMNIITMDEVHKQIKETIFQYNKKELIKEIRDLETNDICEAIKKLPVMNNNSVNNNSNNNNNHEDNINESDKAKYINTKIFEKISNHSSKTKLTVFNEKYRKLIHKDFVFDSLDDEEIEEIEINRFYITPNSIAVYLIDSIILISSLIELLYLPIFLAYNLNYCRNIFTIHQLIFFLIDLFYIIDLITGFFRAYYNFDEFLIKNRKKICKNYLNTWFFTDFIEAIPLYIIFNIMENECKVNDIYLSNYYNININKLQYIFLLIKTFKISKVISKNTVLRKLKSILNDYDFFFEYKIILFIIFIVFSYLNISSCIFIFLGRNSYPGWIIECNIQNNSFSYIYLTSIYYLMTSVTTVGYGDIIVTSFTERIYQIIILIIGTCAYSYSVTYISNYIQKIHEKSINFEKKISILNDIKLSSENLSTELYDKIHRYLQYNRIDKKSNNEILIDCLPYPLNNDLFMEMFKDIIQNFKFFKYIDNTNFIVKVVTSFKPVLSVKNDIIIQEGDFIEDIIFVKEGVLSLEVCIDLNCAQESIEEYLNEGGFGKSKKLNKVKKNKKFETCIYTFKNSFNPNELKFDKIFKNFTQEKEKNKNKKKYLRIINIRKNEYYGDILMFLNERAPFRMKVKSRRAELYYLNKTDAIEISTLYPNIWKKIIQKSLFNMKQIKNLTKKNLVYFSKLNGIVLNNVESKDINNSESYISKSNFINNSQIIEKTNRSWKSRSKDGENEEKNNITKNFSSVIYEEESENIESPLVNSKSRINYNTPKINKKYINNSIKNNKKLESKFNNEIKQRSKENSIDISNNPQTEKLPECNNINSFRDNSEFKKYCFSISDENEINSEIHPNEKFNDNKFLQSCFSKSNENSIDIDKEKNAEKNRIRDYMNNNGIYLNDKIKKICENDTNSLKITYKKITNFENLNIDNTITTTLSSIYENLNQISNYKFSQDINLRKKTIQFLMEESKISSNNSAINSCVSPKNKISNPLYRYSKRRPNSISKYKIRAKNLNFDEEHQSLTSLKKDKNSEFKEMKSIFQMERNSSKFSRGSCKYLSPELKKSNMYKRNKILFKNPNLHRSMQNLYRNETEGLSENIRKKYCKRKKTMQNLVNSKGDQELNFYGKMKTLHGNNNNIVTFNNNSSNNDLLQSSTKKSYLDLISHNILENRQTLSNPQEFYTGFFANIVQNKINKRKRFCKTRKEFNPKKSVEINKNRIKNNKYLFDNNDKRKIKNIEFVKRPYSTNDVIKDSL